MIEFGCCLSLGSFVPQIKQKHGEDITNTFKKEMLIIEKAGFDFAELSVNVLQSLNDNDFNDIKSITKNISIPISVFNCFIPKNLPLTGNNVSIEDINTYLDFVMDRINQLDGKYIIFGSGEARNIPDNFSRDKAKRQIKNFLKICNMYGKKYDLEIAIEPLNRNESNIINTVNEAYEIEKELNLPQISILADMYHMYIENESFDIIEDIKNKLIHVHVSNIERNPPNYSDDKQIFNKLFTKLKSVDYNKGISLECNFSDIETESKVSLDYLKDIWKGT